MLTPLMLPWDVEDFLNRLGNVLKWSSFLCLVITIIFFVLGAASANRMEFYASYSENRYLDSEGVYDVQRDDVYWEWRDWQDRLAPDDLWIGLDDWLERRVAKFKKRWVFASNVATYSIGYWLLTILIQYLWLGSVWFPFRKAPDESD